MRNFKGIDSLRVRLNQLLSRSGRLGVCGRWNGSATLRAYVGKYGPDDVEVSDLGTSESRELKPDNEQRLEGEIPGEVIEDNTESERF